VKVTTCTRNAIRSRTLRSHTRAGAMAYGLYDFVPGLYNPRTAVDDRLAWQVAADNGVRAADGLAFAAKANGTDVPHACETNDIPFNYRPVCQ